MVTGAGVTEVGGASDVVDVGGDVAVEVGGIVVLVTTLVDGCTPCTDVSAAVPNGVDAGEGPATAAPLLGSSPSATEPMIATPVITRAAQAQNGRRRQRRFHHGTRVPPDRSGSGTVESLNVDRRC